MKQFIRLGLVLVMVGFSFCQVGRVTFPVKAEVNSQGTSPQTNLERDNFGNTIRDGSLRFNYILDESGGYQRFAVDQSYNTIAAEPLLSNPYPALPAGSGEESLNSSPSLLSTPVINLDEEWRFTIYGIGLGNYGMAVSDIDNDGGMEIILTSILAEGYVWQILQMNDTNQYELVWTSDVFSTPITNLLVKDINSDGISEIYLSLSDKSIHVINGITRTESSAFTTGINIESMVFGDTNGDDTEEIVISDGVKIAAYNSITFQLLWQTTAYGGRLAVGNVDLDPDPEIVSSAGHILNGLTQAVEWTYPASGGFGARVEIGDVDGDGVNEIVGAASWYKITVFEAEVQSPMWEISTDLDIAALTLADINNDSVYEIVYGDAQWGYIHFVDGITHQEISSIQNSDHGVTRIAVGDPDQDDALEVIWGAGYSSSGPDYLYVVDISSSLIEWKSIDTDGPLSAVDVGDVDDDGNIEIVMASYSSNSGYSDGVIHCFDAVTHELEWEIRDVPGLTIWRGINSLRIGDVDQDGQTEFVIATAATYNGLIQIYDGRTHTLERQSPSYSGEIFTSMEIGDVDGDEKIEIVTGSDREHTGATGVYVRVFDGITGNLEWQSIGLDTYWGGVYDIHLADVDADTRTEIIASLGDTWVYVFDGVSHVLQNMSSAPVRAIASDDVDRNGENSILVGRLDGKINLLNGLTFAPEATFSVSDMPINCLRPADIDQDGSTEWLICTANRLLVFSPATENILWQSKDYKSDFGGYNQVAVGQIDGDINQEVVAGNKSSLIQFESLWLGSLGLSNFSVSAPFAEPGDELIYTMVLDNTGDSTIPNVQVTNPLPAGINYVVGSLWATAGIADFSGGAVSWSGDVPSQIEVTIAYKVMVENVTPRTKIVNQALVTWGTSSRNLSASVLISPAKVFLPICLRPGQEPVCGYYYDGFQDISSGWLVDNDEYMTSGYYSGEYRILAKNTSYIYLIKAPTCKRQNYSVEADARWVGNSGSYYGLIFGLEDDFSSYYIFGINTDYREYALYYYSESGFQTIAADTFSNSIHYGLESNHLKVFRNNNDITLEINGVNLGVWTHAGGTEFSNIGLFNVPYSNLVNADARFDNFLVELLPSQSAALSSNGLELKKGRNELFMEQEVDFPIQKRE